MSDIRRYRRLNPKQQIGLKNFGIKTFVPSPSDRDYRRGYITRHFVRKLNDPNSFIFEVNKEELSRIQANPTYLTVSLDWRISGTEREIKESNRKSLRQASNVIKNIPLFLPNHKQFSKRSDNQ